MLLLWSKIAFSLVTVLGVSRVVDDAVFAGTVVVSVATVNDSIGVAFLEAKHSVQTSASVVSEAITVRALLAADGELQSATGNALHE